MSLRTFEPTATYDPNSIEAQNRIVFRTEIDRPIDVQRGRKNRGELLDEEALVSKFPVDLAQALSIHPEQDVVGAIRKDVDG